MVEFGNGRSVWPMDSCFLLNLTVCLMYLDFLVENWDSILRC